MGEKETHVEEGPGMKPRNIEFGSFAAWAVSALSLSLAILIPKDPVYLLKVNCRLSSLQTRLTVSVSSSESVVQLRYLPSH